jgi:hypothetical protein
MLLEIFMFPWTSALHRMGILLQTARSYFRWQRTVDLRRVIREFLGEFFRWPGNPFIYRKILRTAAEMGNRNNSSDRRM